MAASVLVNLLHGEGLVDVERAQVVAAFAMGQMGLPEGTEVSLSFVDDDEMAAMNEAYRGKQGPTDVLSFECDNLDDGFPEDDGSSPYLLGDIVIAPDVCARQATGYGHGFLEEADLLIVHGVLHLCGYDHIDDDEAAEMEALQSRIVAQWGAQLAEGGAHALR